MINGASVLLFVGEKSPPPGNEDRSASSEADRVGLLPRYPIRKEVSRSDEQNTGLTHGIRQPADLPYSEKPLKHEERSEMSEPHEDPRAAEELAKIKEYLRNFTIRDYCIENYAEFHNISEEEAADILNGCGALDGLYEQDIVVIGHLSMCGLITMLRRRVECCGGTNPPAILPKQMGYETITELYPYRSSFHTFIMHPENVHGQSLGRKTDYIGE